jgi:uncharacterized protein (DUF1800 family)
MRFNALLAILLLFPGRPLTEQQKVDHVVSRITFGPRPGDAEAVRKIGIPEFLEQQLNPERIPDTAVDEQLASIPSIHMNIVEIFRSYPVRRQPTNLFQMAPRARLGVNSPRQLLDELQAQKIIRAVHSERQLQEVMTDFWFNHFNIFWGKGADRWLTTDFEMNAIRPHAMGKFRDLLLATAKSPAMLFYLDNFRSTSLRGINENYARELMELHTMGVNGGYTQKDVQEVARAFTGWSIDRPRVTGQFIFRPRIHDTGEKVVLGTKINAGGIKDGEMVIDVLARHPSTAKFIAAKLVTRFVSDDPPAPLVDRVADVYRKTDGDIREMLRAIFTSPDFFSPEAMNAKMKSPFELAVSAIRSLGGTTDGSRGLAQMISRMGEPLYQYQPPTGFPDRASQWTSTGSMLERLNFAIALTENRIPGTTVQLDLPAKDVAARLGSPEFQRR